MSEEMKRILVNFTWIWILMAQPFVEGKLQLDNLQ